MIFNELGLKRLFNEEEEKVAKANKHSLFRNKKAEIDPDAEVVKTSFFDKMLKPKK